MFWHSTTLNLNRQEAKIPSERKRTFRLFIRRSYGWHEKGKNEVDVIKNNETQFTQCECNPVYCEIINM